MPQRKEIRLTPPQVAGYKSGRMSAAELASIHQCSTPTILARLREAGCDTDRRGGRRGPKVVLRQSVIDRYAARELSVEAVAQITGCSPAAAWRALHRAGVTGQGHAPIKVWDHEAEDAARVALSALLTWLADVGYPDAQIGEKCGVVASVIARWREYRFAARPVPKK